MKKITTKRSWLLGLLVGLVMLVGAVPAMAGYCYVGNFYDSTFASSSAGGFYTSIATSPVYGFDKNSNDFFVTNMTNPLAEIEKDDNGAPWGLTGIYNQVVVKDGSHFVDLWTWCASDPGSGIYMDSMASVDNDDYKLLVGHVQGDISYIAGYNAVPIPGAVWLLGSGLGGLLISRRRRKK